MRQWTTAQVARASGVSSRALRHWDALGLLVPAGTGAGGVRLYGQAELLRLQRLLLLRALGLPLSEVRALLDEGAPASGALRAHLARLDAEAERLHRLRSAVRSTLERLDRGDDVDPSTMFDGLDPVRQAGYEREIADRWGEEVVTAARERTAALPPGELAVTGAAFAAVEQAVADLMASGARPDDPRVLDALDAHLAVVRRSWSPDADAYAGLGDLYAEHPDFQARYEARAAGLADFLREALAAYALARL